jgi:hypothetical protein
VTIECASNKCGDVFCAFSCSSERRIDIDVAMGLEYLHEMGRGQYLDSVHSPSKRVPIGHYIWTSCQGYYL